MKPTREPSGSRHLTVDVYVRPTLLSGSTDGTLATLKRLERDGIVSDVSIHPVPEKVNLTGCSEYGGFVELYDRLERWATAHDLSLAPSFSTSSTTSELWGETRRVVRMPMLSLLVYWGSQLIGVFPHSTDRTHRSVEAALAGLETGRFETVLPESSTFRRAAADECPECDGLLVNTQGVLCCYDCLWDGLTARDASPSERANPPSTLPS